MITIDDVIEAHSQQMLRQVNDNKAWQEKYKNIKYKDQPKYTGFFVDYPPLMKMLLQAIQEEYGFSLARAEHINQKAYEMGHANGSDIFCYARELCEFVKSLPN